MDATLGFVGAVLGAVLGGVVVGIANWILLDRQHKQAIALQERQHSQALELQKGQGELERIARETQWHWEARTEHDRWINAQADRKDDWNRQRKDRQEQAALDRDAERRRSQEAALRELEQMITRFSRASRAIYDHRIQARLLKEEGSLVEELSPEARLKLQQSSDEFNDLRYAAIAAISRIENEKVRQAAGNLYGLNEHIVLSETVLWSYPQHAYGGREPSILQVDWQRQLLRMVGKVLRGDSIDEEVVEQNVHQEARIDNSSQTDV